MNERGDDRRLFLYEGEQMFACCRALRLLACGSERLRDLIVEIAPVRHNDDARPRVGHDDGLGQHNHS